MYDIFGKYGAIRQIRLGNEKSTLGTAFVVYEDVFDARRAREKLSGFNVCGRYLIVLYYQPKKMQKREDQKRKQEEIAALRKQYAALKREQEEEEKEEIREGEGGK